MTTTIQTPLENPVDFRSPSSTGVYFLKHVSALLRATDHIVDADEFSLSPQQISGWAKKGFARIEIDEVFSRNRFIRFPDLITLRMVAILRSQGISLKKTTIAHDFLTKALRTSHPFVDRALWVDDAEFAEDIYAKVDHLLVTASRYGQHPFTELLTGKIVDVANMTFDDERFAVSWAPHADVVLDPDVHAGASCLKGTRISTGVIFGMYIAGETIGAIADWYEIEDAQVETAIGWEERLAA